MTFRRSQGFAPADVCTGRLCGYGVKGSSAIPAGDLVVELTGKRITKCARCAGLAPADVALRLHELIQATAPTPMPTRQPSLVSRGGEPASLAQCADELKRQIDERRASAPPRVAAPRAPMAYKDLPGSVRRQHERQLGN